MKPLFNFRGYSARVSFATLSGAFLFATLTGCGGMGTIPDTSIPGEAVHPGAIQGSVFGGHAPIVGAEVYILQAGTTGYASTATNLMTSGNSGTDSVHGKYVSTAADGSFNLTGDYTCTVGRPVYLLGLGGQTSTNIGGPTYSTTPITITGASSAPVPTTPYFLLTFTGNNLLYPGQNVVFNNLTGGYAGLNGGSSTVTGATDTSFTVLFSANITGTTTGNAVPLSAINPSIANIAVLGNCPATGNFSTGGTGSNVISYVYMNEVSTVAAAYALSGYGSGPFNIGYPSTSTLALTGIQNATVNAGQLYNIEGKYLSMTFAGEGHIANPTTPAGNGVVPQSTLDTLGNIVASCVDSQNTAISTSNPNSAGISSSCSKLFTYATSNGVPYGFTGVGTIATDTATAAFNIAHNPAGNSAYTASFMAGLYILQGSQVTPFSPNLAAAPNDFTVAITYSAQTDMGNPESIAIDGTGDVFYSNQSSGYLTKMLPTGAISANYNTGVTPGYLSVDPSGNIWNGAIGGGTPILELTNAMAFKAKTAANYSTVSAAATDSSGNFYFISATPAFSVYELTSTMGNATHSPFTGSNTCIPSGVTYDHLTIDGTQSLWVTDEHGGKICRFTTTGGVTTGYPITTANGAYPENIGIDSTGNAWVTLEQNNTVAHITHVLSGTLTTTNLTSGSTGATFNEPFSAAVDGAGNIWITNRTGNSIAELNNSGIAVSPATNYQSTGGLSDPLNAAIDGSGDVWISNYNGNEVVELVGAAVPTVTPLSYASGAAGLGNKP